MPCLEPPSQTKNGHYLLSRKRTADIKDRHLVSSGDSAVAASSSLLVLDLQVFQGPGTLQFQHKPDREERRLAVQRRRAACRGRRYGLTAQAS